MVDLHNKRTFSLRPNDQICTIQSFLKSVLPFTATPLTIFRSPYNSFPFDFVYVTHACPGHLLQLNNLNALDKIQQS